MEGFVVNHEPLKGLGNQPVVGKGNVTVYNRLVRDRIPEIIESMGNIAVWQTLDDESYSKALLDTIVRSSLQFAETESLESLADLIETIEAWLEARGLTMDEVDRARAEKHKRCGGYDGRRFLEVVADGKNVDALAKQDWHC
jgi:predicted house-cleaning noncanonical NTP pyrophosphatase (MazG superfamily)